MASPAPGEQPPSVQAGQKRKREDEETDVKHDIKNEVKNEIENEKKAEADDEDVEDDGGAKIDTNTLVPDDYEHAEESNDECEDSDEDNENAVEDNANYPKHDESDEPFPACAYYDEVVDDIDEKLTSIAERVYDLLEEHNSSSATFAAHKSKAEELSKIPNTEKIRIAILGGAGAGKSSLLNAITGKHDLAKSVSSHSMFYQ
jgi:predicted GTPase